MERFYEMYLHGSAIDFAMSRDYCAGLYAFRGLNLKNKLPRPKAVKGQITGPVSFGLQVVDEQRKPIFYNDMLKDILIKNLRRKAEWQEGVLRDVCPRTITFIDEPYLSAFGSAWVSLEREEVISALQEVLGGLKGAKGVHCCANTDWSLLTAVAPEVLSFDAYYYAKNFALYPNEIAEFLELGGVVAWGIVPTAEKDILRETTASLVKKLEKSMQLLVEKGIKLERLLAQALITPSCGIGAENVKTAEQVIAMSRAVADALRRKYELE
jgi:hypothetical protein